MQCTRMGLCAAAAVSMSYAARVASAPPREWPVIRIYTRHMSEMSVGANTNSMACAACRSRSAAFCLS